MVHDVTRKINTYRAMGDPGQMKTMNHTHQRTKDRAT